MSVKKELEVVCRALYRDQDYFFSWQANIAMAMLDETMMEFGYQKPELRDVLLRVVNKGAKRFLYQLINESIPTT
jgi:hypothetical protein